MKVGYAKNCDKLFHLEKTGKPFSVPQMDIECLVGYLKVIVPWPKIMFSRFVELPDCYNYNLVGRERESIVLWQSQLCSFIPPPPHPGIYQENMQKRFYS